MAFTQYYVILQVDCKQSDVIWLRCSNFYFWSLDVFDYIWHIICKKAKNSNGFRMIPNDSKWFESNFDPWTSYSNLFNSIQVYSKWFRRIPSYSSLLRWRQKVQEWKVRFENFEKFCQFRNPLILTKWNKLGDELWDYLQGLGPSTRLTE